MNTADGMSDEELDVWADIFYQGKIGGLIAVTFSQFISSPFMDLSSALQRMDRPVKDTPCLHQVYSKDPSPKISLGNVTEFSPQSPELSGGLRGCLSRP